MMHGVDWHRTSGTIAVQYADDNNGCDLDAVLPVFMEEREIRRTIVFSGRKQKGSSSDENPYNTDLSTDLSSPGVLKIFGPSILPGVEYKSVLASYRSTAPELVKQALERYGIHPSLYDEYVLCDVVGRQNEYPSETNHTFLKVPKWKRLCSRVLSDTDRPLVLQNFWRPCETTSRRYELRKKSETSSFHDEDDTYGLNENARKISISKLRRGAIPFYSPWETSEFTKISDPLDLGDNFQHAHSTWNRQKNDQNILINSLNLDTTRTMPRPASALSAPSNGQLKTFLGPVSRPFLLTVRGYDVNRDSVLYTLDDKTTLVCNANSKQSNMSCISLFAPDIHPQHCHLLLKRITNSRNPLSEFNYCIDIDCAFSANIKVNGYSVVGRITVHPGDLVSIGNHYIFLLKDFTAGHEIPSQLSWLSSDDIVDSIVDRRQSDVKRRQNVVHVPPLVLESVVEDNISVCTVESFATETQQEKFRFAYSAEKEDELVKAIGAIVREHNVDFPLTSAYLYSMCIQYSCVRFDRHQVRNLLLKILMAVRESVAEISKGLKVTKFNSGLVRTRRPSTTGEDFLKSMVQWMSNGVQMIIYLRDNNFSLRTSSNDHLRRHHDDADMQSAFQELAAGFEEIVVYCFQQTIYSITKALYILLPAVLDDNPFPDNPSIGNRSAATSKTNMRKIISIMDSLSKLMNSLHLHSGVCKQVFMYIFFFCSTSIFNRLFTKDASSLYYNWASGVRIRANIGHLEDWANRNGLDEEFGQLFEKLLKATEFLSTSKSLLNKYDWITLKKHFYPLNEGQLYRLLSGYHTDRRSIPAYSLPPPEDRELALLDEDTFIDLAGHPPFVVPTDGCLMDLKQPPDSPIFWAVFKKLYEEFGVTEDETESSRSPRGNRQFTGNFPKVELQNSFFCRSLSPKSARKGSSSSESHRKVQFTTDTDSSDQFSPRENTVQFKTKQTGLKGSSAENISARAITNAGVPIKPKRNNKPMINSMDSKSKLQSQPTSGASYRQHEQTPSETDNRKQLGPPPPPPRSKETIIQRNCQQVPPVTRSASVVSVQSDRSSVSGIVTLQRPKREVIQGTNEYGQGQIENGRGKIKDEQENSENFKEIRNTRLEIGIGIGEDRHVENGFRLGNNDTCNNCPNREEKRNSVDLMRSVNKQIVLPQQTTKKAVDKRELDKDNQGSKTPSPRYSSNSVHSVNVSKGDSGLGLGLIDGLYTPLRLAGIYIRKILPNSPADLTGSLNVGDRLLSVNGKSIVGADYQSCMKLIKLSGTTMTLLVARGNQSIATKIAATNC